MSRPFMPFYDGDWMRDTAHLDDHQERAYFRLMMFYWASEKLPTDEGQLARIARMTPAKWKKNREVLVAFFEPNWIHKRIEKELEKSRNFVEKQRLNGAKPKARYEPERSLFETRARVPQPQPKDSSSFYVKMGTPQREAWNSYSLRTTGKSLPADRDGGWRVTAEWPPDSQAPPIARIA